jgi:predicted HAD superfamily Cof-like phosphohydrolase
MTHHEISLQDFKSMLKMVSEFQNYFSHPQNNDITWGYRKTRALRVSLLNEELEELVRAVKQDDHTEVLDAIVDALYIQLGTLLYHGLGDYLEALCYDSNLNATNLYLPAEEIIEKFKGMEKEDINSLKELFSKGVYEGTYIAFNIQNYLVFMQYWINTNTILLKLFNHYKHSGIFNCTLIEAFKEVHYSNLSKLDINGKPIYRQDGKILKGENFVKPNLSQFVNK